MFPKYSLSFVICWGVTPLVSLSAPLDGLVASIRLRRAGVRSGGVVQEEGVESAARLYEDEEEGEGEKELPLRVLAERSGGSQQRGISRSSFIR